MRSRAVKLKSSGLKSNPSIGVPVIRAQAPRQSPAMYMPSRLDLMLSSSGASKLPEAKSALACGQGEVERVEEQPKYRGTCYVHKRRAKALPVCNLDGTRLLSSSGASKLPEAKCARVRPRRPRRPKAAKVRSSGLKSNPSGGTCHMHKRRAKVLPVCTMQPCQTLKQRKQHPGTLATVKGACKFHVSVAECPLSCQ